MLKNIKKFASVILISSIALLTGCQSQEEKDAIYFSEMNKTLTKTVENKIQSLEKDVLNRHKKGRYELITEIALKEVEKEHASKESIQDLVKVFREDMTTKGTPFTSLKSDVDNVLKHEARKFNNQVDFSNATNVTVTKMRNYNNELIRVKNAIVNYDDRFIDYVNSLAALSKNVNPIIVSEQSNDAPFGSQFVGNPNYGEWVTTSNGDSHWSFWEVYGVMSFVDDIFDGGSSRHYGSYSSYKNRGYKDYGYSSRYRYDNWHNKRNYSYYNDVYSKHYESPKNKAKTAIQTNKLNKKYSSNLVKTTNVSKQTSKIKTPKYNSNLVSPKRANSGYNSGGGIKRNQTPSINAGK